MILQVCKLKATREIFAPEFSSGTTIEDVERQLLPLTRPKALLVSDLMTITGMSRTGVKEKLLRAGVKPVEQGGKSGRENKYDRGEALQALGVI